MFKHIIVIIFLVFLLGSCRKDISDLNIDIKNPSTAPSYALFSNGQRNFADIMTSSNVNDNIFRLLVQHWTQTQYTDETNYDITTRTIPDRLWGILYRDVLTDLRRAKDFIPAEVPDPNTQKNQLAIVDIMEVHAFSVLVTIWGDVPYTEALNPEIAFPKYDAANTIWLDLISRLDADITALNTSAPSFGSADLLYGGDVAKWKKFANSLKFKLGMVLADVDASKAKSVVESAAPGIFTSSADDAEFHYFAATPNTNPIWVDLVQSQRNDFVPAVTLVDAMNTLNDPRRPLYFDNNVAGYIGGQVGPGVDFNVVSHIAEQITEPDASADLLSYSEIEFLLAEAVERGFSVGGGSAQQHYNNAITASIIEWGGTAAEAATYLSQPAVAYNTAAGDYKQKIGTQMWLSLYNRGYDAWLQYRRFDAPALTVPSTALSDFPVRFTYPVDEQNLNSTNYDRASESIGGDDVTVKLWFDKF